MASLAHPPAAGMGIQAARAQGPIRARRVLACKGRRVTDARGGGFDEPVAERGGDSACLLDRVYPECGEWWRGPKGLPALLRRRLGDSLFGSA